MAPVQTPSIPLLACLCALVCACTTSPDVSGVWHVEAPVNKLILDEVAGKALGLELVIGEYGPDLAGLLRYYRSGQFDQPRSPVPPHNLCECAFLHAAKVDSAGNVTFELDACVPGKSPKAPLALSGVFTLQVDGRLKGTLTADDPSQPTIVDAVQLTFVRVATTAESDPAILDCQHPATLADGNTASGL